MATFAVTVERIVEPVTKHPNADRLSIVQIGDYRAISANLEDGSTRYKQGDLVAYVPEGALVPEWLLKRMGFWDEAKGKGTLAGSEGRRVKAIKLRGVLSQGLLIPVVTLNDQVGEVQGENCNGVVTEGDNIAEFLGVTKYEAPIPVAMGGEVKNLFGYPVPYDIENRKRFPNVLLDDEEVVMTEKVHGTFCQIGWLGDIDPDPELFGDGRVFITSKGLGAKGIVLKNNEANAGNLYVRAMKQMGLIDAIQRVAREAGHKRLYLMGEVFGSKVQDLQYGMSQNQIDFRLFEVMIASMHGDSHWVDSVIVPYLAEALNVQQVPILWRGKWKDAKDQIAEIATGPTVLTDQQQIREGVVIRPTWERTDPALGRVILKEVSEAYLLRKGEVTEFA